MAPEHQGTKNIGRQLGRVLCREKVRFLGNVALDIARLAGETRKELATSDLCAHAREKLASASFSDIWLVGRRGPLEAAFTNAELAEIGQLARVAPIVDARDIPSRLPAELSEGTGKHIGKNLEVLRGFAARGEQPDKPIRLDFLFNAAPIELLGEKRVRKLKLERTKVDNQGWMGTGETFEISADTVISVIPREKFTRIEDMLRVASEQISR